MKQKISRLFLACAFLAVCLSVCLFPASSGKAWADERESRTNVGETVKETAGPESEASGKADETNPESIGASEETVKQSAEESKTAETETGTGKAVETETETGTGKAVEPETETGSEPEKAPEEAERETGGEPRPGPWTARRSGPATRAAGDTGTTYAMYMAVTKPLSISAFGQGTTQMWEHIIQTEGATRTAYCMEYGVPLGAGTLMTWTDMSSQSQKEIGYALHFGWKHQAYDEAVYQDETNRTEYAMTQAVIWSVVSGVFHTEVGDAACRQVADACYLPDHAWEYYLYLKEAILSAETVPSFAGRNSDGSAAYEIVLSWNDEKGCYESYMEDANSCLERFDFSMEGVTFEKEGNRLRLCTSRRCDEPVISGPAIFETGGGAGAAIIWDADGGQQDLVTEYEAAVVPVKAFLKIRTEEPERTVPVKLRIFKKDQETKAGLSGAVFHVYANGERIGTMDDQGDGTYTYETGIQGIRGSTIKTAFRIVEAKSPEGYRNSGWETMFEGTDTITDDLVIAYESEAENEAKKGRIHLRKTDAQTGASPQGDGTFAGAVYDIFAMEDIYTADGQEKLYAGYAQGDDLSSASYVTSLVTDGKGEASSDLLPLGRYVVIERTPPAGYLLDETAHTVDLTDDGQDIPVQEVSVASKEQIIRRPAALLKTGDGAHGGTEALEGVGFEFYLRSALSRREDGSWDFESGAPVAVTPDGGTELFTGTDGKAVTVPLAYGVYVVRESTVPHNYKACEPFEIRVDENGSEPAQWQTVANEAFKARLKIIKQDGESGETILKAGAVFRVLDLETGEYIRQTGSSPDGGTDLFETDDSGTLITPEVLKPGNYRVEEVTAPEGYNKGSAVDIRIDEDGFFQLDDHGVPVVSVTISNEAQKGRIRIVKQGERLTAYKKRASEDSGKTFVYSMTGLAGVRFDVYAAEDIYSPDGHGHLIYQKDERIGVMTSDDAGEAVLDGLPLGAYRVQEKDPPSGFLAGDGPLEVRLTWNKTEEAAEWSQIYENERQKMTVQVLKKDSADKKGLKAAKIGLYAGMDIVSSDGGLLVKKGGLIEEVTTDESGKGVFRSDLPTDLAGGKAISYYIKEIEAPEGYVLSGDKRWVDQAAADEKGVVEIGLENAPVTVRIEKRDKSSKERVAGAKLEAYQTDPNGKITEKQPTFTMVTSADKPCELRGVPAGYYVLREAAVPGNGGYVKADDIHFQVKAIKDIQKVIMEEDYTKLKILKKDAEDGSMLSGAVLELYDKAGKRIHTWKTSDIPEQIEHIEPGTYTLREKTAPEGYETAEDMTFEVKATADVQEIILYNQKENPDKEHPVKKIMTGDNAPIALLITLCLVSLSMILLLLKKYKKG